MDTINPADNAFLLICAAMVMFMNPGLALFYGGMVRSKNVLGTVMQSFFILGLATMVWVVVGYSLAFGSSLGGVVGGLDYLGLNGVGQEPSGYAETVPHLTFMMFQGMFAIITPALITGAFAERMRFPGFVLFTVIWLLLVYSPVCHWVWGGGWIGEMGALDFAGGTVVHINSAAAALAAALVLGARKGLGSVGLSPHNLPMTVLGAAMLWFGWFGFNAGSALGAGSLSASAFVMTQIGAAAATISWVVAEWIHRGKPTTLGAATGCVAGLVAITPAAGFVGAMPALVIGLLAGAVCYGAVMLKWRLKYDDALDVVGVHGAGGILGALCTGIFASLAINSGGADGLLFGNAALFGVQVVAVAVTAVYSFVVSFIILKVVDGTVGLRVSLEDEDTGLDLTQHSEAGYAI